MKKQWLALGLSLVMVIGCSLTAFAADQGAENNLLAGKNGDVVWMSNDDVPAFDTILNTSPETVDSFFNSQGILVVTGNETAEPMNLEERLNLPVREEDTAPALTASDETIVDPGIDIATIYYKHGDVFAVHEVNIGSDDAVDRNALVEDVLTEVRENQTQPVATYSDGYLIGEKDYTYTREPKGKLTAYYDIYTVQNYNSKDHYIVKATVDGMPGCILGGSYDTKYQGEDLDVTISSSSSSVTIDDYGPERIAGSTSVGVNIGGTLGKEMSVQLGLSWTFNVKEVDIDVSKSTSSVTWNSTLKNGAQKTTFTCKPGVNFQCPSNKESISVTTKASYTLDSWDTSREEISLNKTFTCDASSVS